MKKTLLILFVFLTSNLIAQTDWQDLINRLPLVKLPYTLNLSDSTSFKPILVNRNEVWNYLLKDSSIDFNKADKLMIDKTTIGDYGTWLNSDWKKYEPIPVFCAIQGGDIYALCKTKIHDNQYGIFWLLKTNTGPIMSGYGSICWLYTYTTTGKMIDSEWFSSYNHGFGGLCSFTDSVFSVLKKDLTFNTNFYYYGQCIGSDTLDKKIINNPDSVILKLYPYADINRQDSIVTIFKDVPYNEHYLIKNKINKTGEILNY